MRGSIPILLSALVFVSATGILAPSARAEVYVGCDVSGVGVFEERVHIRCSQPYTGTSIAYFAVPASKRDMASRFQADALVAQVTGDPIVINFSLADTSGTSVGCSASDCRLALWVETTGTGPLLSVQTGATVATVAAITLPEPLPRVGTLATGSVLAGLAVGRRRRPASP